MRLWPGDDTSVKGFRSAFTAPPRRSGVPRLHQILSDSDTIILSRLAGNGLQMEKLVSPASSEPWFLPRSLLLHLACERQWNFPLNAIKISGRAGVLIDSVCAARLTSGEPTPPRSQAVATQLWFIHFFPGRHSTHAKHKTHIHIIARDGHYHLHIALRY